MGLRLRLRAPLSAELRCLAPLRLRLPPCSSLLRLSAPRLRSGLRLRASHSSLLRLSALLPLLISLFSSLLRFSMLALRPRLLLRLRLRLFFSSSLIWLLRAPGLRLRP